MKIHFLGTGVFSSRRYDTSIALEHEGIITVLDCGEPCTASLMRQGRSPTSMLERVENIVISHMHLDHTSGFPMLLYQVVKYRSKLSTSENKKEVNVLVPSCANPEILEPLGILNMSGSFDKTVVEYATLYSLNDGGVFEGEGLEITSYSNEHRDAESYAFLVEAGDLRVFYTGDLPESLDPVEEHLDDLDLLIIEAAHIEPPVAAERLCGRDIRRVVFSHVSQRYQGVEDRLLSEVEGRLPGPTVDIAEDGLVLEV